jgi:alkanesulfonate monooxygenase SsuD/methylene tetrahydromethanopterin reductase-like flavin-dependent oxidoreductase (luciferase family)
MKFGINFFPTVGPDEKPAHQYYEECLSLAELADDLGYAHVKTVEHYFFPYGGYSPDPVTFLAAAAARTSRIRLATGAAIPAFTHPVKLAGKLAMLDNISRGRLDVGFGRAFLPEEFTAFDVPIDESRQRFDEGVEACRRLWTEENVTWEGTFHQFGPVTLLPRPFQQPCPPILVASASSAESCEAAGRKGYGLLLVPSISPVERVQELLDGYRKAWADAGHPGIGTVQMSYNCYISEDRTEALRAARIHADNYTSKLQGAVEAWGTTRSSAYPGYEKLIEAVKKNDFDTSLAEGKVLAGTPDDVAAAVDRIRGWFGEVTLSLQVNSGNVPVWEAARSLKLFAAHVMPSFAGAAEPAGAAR